ncbi:hypothetical protein HDU93_000130 [Gonapodya sp. JEL0774]|nr:hypothetical protein HDU93_000130 [Gonapodya sp. JEL0774]
MATLARAHIEMANPPPRNSKWIPSSLGVSNIDYDGTTPLGAARPYPCQGKPKGPIVATYQAGTSVHVSLFGSATHDGGHCQFAVSYDSGSTFVVLLTVVRECLRASGSEYNVPIPAGAPSGDAVFAWTWINAVGNREYYMGCADVNIQGSAGGSISGPQLFVANIAPSSVVIPEFPGADGAKYDGRNYLTARPTITVRAGQQGPGIFTGNGVTPVTAPPPSSPPPPASTGAGAPVAAQGAKTPVAAPAAAPATSGVGCTVGMLQCLPSVSAQAFQQCAQTGWSSKSCPSGTACQVVSSQLGSEIACGYPGSSPPPPPPATASPPSSPPATSHTTPSPPPSPPAASKTKPSTAVVTQGGSVLLSGAGCAVGTMQCLVKRSSDFDEVVVSLPAKRRRSPGQVHSKSDDRTGPELGQNMESEDLNVQESLSGIRLRNRATRINYSEDDPAKRRRQMEESRYTQSDYLVPHRRERPINRSETGSSRYALRGTESSSQDPLTQSFSVAVNDTAENFESDGEREDSGEEGSVSARRRRANGKRGKRDWKHHPIEQRSDSESPRKESVKRRGGSGRKTSGDIDVEELDTKDESEEKPSPLGTRRVSAQSQRGQDFSSVEVDSDGDSDYEASGADAARPDDESSDGSETDSLVGAPTDNEAARRATDARLSGKEGRQLRPTRARKYNERAMFRAIKEGQPLKDVESSGANTAGRLGLRARRDGVDYKHDLRLKKLLEEEQRRSSRRRTSPKASRKHVGPSSFPMGRAFGGDEDQTRDSDSDEDQVRRRERTGNLNAKGLLKTSSSITAKLKPVASETLGDDTFDSVAGLEEHIRSLKEMIVLPLLYPHIYERFKIKPPRGVLFHGPPGTGKTMLARALANSCSTEAQKVTFYSRKGGDILSKWVGEGERQLGLLFESARATQPSIIFFDEIDGLAPVRTSGKQEQSQSIVATLLGLMNGLDDRGQVVVIGATNRIDALDPALRRPGRFDREFYFPLPGKEARAKIIELASKDWDPPLAPELREQLVETTQGYAGADVKAIVTEAVLNAVRRVYPQIYRSKERLVVQPEKITVELVDFLNSVRTVVASTNRSSFSSARPLPKPLEPLLAASVQRITAILEVVLPIATKERRMGWLHQAASQSMVTDGGVDFELVEDNSRSLLDESRYPFASSSFSASSLTFYQNFRPKLLICGDAGLGQTTYVGPAVLKVLEGWKVFIQPFDLGNLVRDSKDVESGLVGYFTSLRRHQPACAYLPNIDVFWDNLNPCAQATFLHLLLSVLDPHEPVILVATSERPLEQLVQIMGSLLDQVFGFVGQVGKLSREAVEKQGVFELSTPSDNERRDYFTLLYREVTTPPPQSFLTIKSVDSATLGIIPKPRRTEDLPDLPKAPPGPLKQVETPEERQLKEKNAKLTLLSLKQTLREMTSKMLRGRYAKRYELHAFVHPASIPADGAESVPKPSDEVTLRIIFEKNERGSYVGVDGWLADISKFCEKEKARWKEYIADNTERINEELEAKKMIGDLFDEAVMFTEMQEEEFVEACRESARILRLDSGAAVTDSIVEVDATEILHEETQDSVLPFTESGTPVPSDWDTSDTKCDQASEIRGEFADISCALNGEDVHGASAMNDDFHLPERDFAELLNVSTVNTRAFTIVELEELAKNLARTINARRGDWNRSWMVESLIEVYRQMDKIKEKLEKLRIESEATNARANKAEDMVKMLNDELGKKEVEINGLKNKISLLETEIQRAEKRIDDLKSTHAEAEKGSAQGESLQRKLTLLEAQIEDKERIAKEAVEKYRASELKAEHAERRAAQLEKERDSIENKLNETNHKYEETKKELEQTLKELEGL